MSGERNILSSAIQSREAWATVSDHLDVKTLTAQGQVIWSSINDYYGRDSEANTCDADLLARAVLRKVTNPKHKETFEGLVRRLSDVDVSPANVVADYIAMNREVVANQLAAALTGGDQEHIDKLLEEYESWKGDEIPSEQRDELEILDGVLIDELMETDLAKENLIKLYPKSLNDRIGGGCVRGHHVVLFARPEAGKTAFLVNAMYGFLSQGLTVVYVGNEDPIRTIMARLQYRIVGKTLLEVASNKQRAREQAIEAGFGLVKWVPASPGTPKQIDYVCSRLKPDVLIVDQLRNLQSKDDGFTQQLEHVARDVRAIGQRHNCLAVSVTQAGATAEGKAFLDMGDVDSSKTGIPAQADLMIGLGFDQADEQAGRRTLSLIKNKLSGEHVAFKVGINPALSKFSTLE